MSGSRAEDDRWGVTVMVNLGDIVMGAMGVVANFGVSAGFGYR